MRIIEDTVRRLTIDMVPKLDPIRVLLEDIGPRQGRITIECYSQSWSAYWGGMGDRKIAEFFSSCGVGYLAGKLSDIKSHVFDPDQLCSFLKKELIKQRRQHELDSDSARDFFDEIQTIDSTHTVDSLWHTHFDLLVKLLGDDWYCGGSLPTKPNPDYEYLCLIIRTVQQALEKRCKPMAKGDKNISAKTERAKLYATGKISARKLHDKDLKPFYVGSIGGKCVTMDSNIKHRTKDAAIDDARKFRQHSANVISDAK